jgi:hypothetical protein
VVSPGTPVTAETRLPALGPKKRKENPEDPLLRRRCAFESAEKVMTIQMPMMPILRILFFNGKG